MGSLYTIYSVFKSKSCIYSSLVFSLVIAGQLNIYDHQFCGLASKV